MQVNLNRITFGRLFSTLSIAFSIQDLFGPIKTDKYLMCLQIILENFAHFLNYRNGVGNVFYEHVDTFHDKVIRNRFTQIIAMGTMFVSPDAMQEHLQTISFPTKSENLVGLQIADFVPNGFARKHLGLKPHRFNIQQQLEACEYRGNPSFTSLFFSMKQLP